MNWVQEIRDAESRIRPHIRETPVEQSWFLSQEGGAEVYLKLEHLQHTGSFKLRGASNRLRTLPPAALAQGVIAASTGNHGMAVCYAARQLRTRATIYMAQNAHPAKLALIRALGGEVVFHGDNPVHAELQARRVAEQTGVAFVSPYNDPAVIAGQGTIGIELERQLGAVDAVFISVGGGGLISGISSYLKAVNPKVRIVGCWPENSRVMYECIRAGTVIEYPEQPTISDSTAGGVETGAITLDLCRSLIDDSVLVSEDEILRAMKIVLERERWLVEGAAGVAVAAYRKRKDAYAGKRVVLLLCGRNIAPEKAQKIWQVA